MTDSWTAKKLIGINEKLDTLLERQNDSVAHNGGDLFNAEMKRWKASTDNHYTNSSKWRVGSGNPSNFV